MQGGTRHAGVAVAAPDSIVWASVLLPRTSAQKAELIALTQKLTKGKIANVHRDNRYTIATANALGLIAEERLSKTRMRFWP